MTQHTVRLFMFLNAAVLFTPQADLPTQRLPIFGGTGGAAFSLDCGSGKVMTGVRARSGRLVDAVGLLCRPVNSNGSLGSETTVGAIVGGGGGTIDIRRCGTDAVVAGLNIHYGSVVDGFSLYCRSWQAITRTMQTSTSGYQGTVGNLSVDSKKDISRCESNRQPASGLRGRAGMLVDAIGLVCDEP